MLALITPEVYDHKAKKEDSDNESCTSISTTVSVGRPQKRKLSFVTRSRTIIKKLDQKHLK